MAGLAQLRARRSECKYTAMHDLRSAEGRHSFTQLFNLEQKCVAPEAYLGVVNALSARRCAVFFMENLKKETNCGALIPYKAMNYLDRFLCRATHPIREEILSTEENFKICSFACFRLAMLYQRQTALNIPDTPEFWGTNPDSLIQNLKKFEDKIYPCLEGHYGNPTPFDYLPFLFPIPDLPPHIPLLRRRVRQLIIKSQLDIALTVYRPSVVAVAALLTIIKHTFPITHCNWVNVWVDSILNLSEHLKPLEEKVLQCEQILTRTYRGFVSIHVLERVSWICAAEKGWIDDYQKTQEQEIMSGDGTNDDADKKDDEEPTANEKDEEEETAEKGADDEKDQEEPDEEMMNFELGWMEPHITALMTRGSQKLE